MKPRSPRTLTPLQIAAASQTPPYERGLYGPQGSNIGPRSWVSVFGEPGIEMSASLTAGAVFVQNGSSSQKFTFPDDGRKELEVRYILGASPFSMLEVSNRFAATCVVMGVVQADYKKETSLVFGNYRFATGSQPIYAYGVSTYAPANPGNTPYQASCSVYVVVTSPPERPYSKLHIDFDNPNAFVPGHLDGDIPLTDVKGYNQYAMADIRYTGNDRRQVIATITVPEVSGQSVTVTLQFVPFPLSSANRL